MRIAHEIMYPMQSSVSAVPYKPAPDTTGYNGARVKVVMASSPRVNFPKTAKLTEPDNPEVIHVEGGLEYVLDAFRQVVSQLEGCKKVMRRSNPRSYAKTSLRHDDCDEGGCAECEWTGRKSFVR